MHFKGLSGGSGHAPSPSLLGKCTAACAILSIRVTGPAQSPPITLPSLSPHSLPRPSYPHKNPSLPIAFTYTPASTNNLSPTLIPKARPRMVLICETFIIRSAYPRPWGPCQQHHRVSIYRTIYLIPAKEGGKDEYIPRINIIIRLHVKLYALVGPDSRVCSHPMRRGTRSLFHPRSGEDWDRMSMLKSSICMDAL